MDVNEITHKAEEEVGKAKEFLHNDLDQTKKDISDNENKAFQEKGMIEEKLHNATHKEA